MNGSRQEGPLRGYLAPPFESVVFSISDGTCVRGSATWRWSSRTTAAPSPLVVVRVNVRVELWGLASAWYQNETAPLLAKFFTRRWHLSAEEVGGGGTSGGRAVFGRLG